MKSLIKFTEEKSIMCELHGEQNPITPMHLFQDSSTSTWTMCRITLILSGSFNFLTPLIKDYQEPFNTQHM